MSDNGKSGRDGGGRTEKAKQGRQAERAVRYDDRHRPFTMRISPEVVARCLAFAQAGERSLDGRAIPGKVLRRFVVERLEELERGEEAGSVAGGVTGTVITVSERPPLVIDGEESDD